MKAHHLKFIFSIYFNRCFSYNSNDKIVRHYYEWQTDGVVRVSLKLKKADGKFNKISIKDNQKQRFEVRKIHKNIKLPNLLL